MFVKDRWEGELGKSLYEARPRLRGEAVDAFEERARRVRARRRAASLRVGLAGAVSATMLVALASVGGISYAATQVQHAARVVQHAVTPAETRGAVGIDGATAGGDQYKPGYGWGDKNHTHDGPPGLTRKGGSFAPPLQTRTVGATAYVSTAFTLDEQAQVTISVVNPTTGAKVLLTQGKSSVGDGVHGTATKNIQYRVLVPRTIPVRIAIPTNLLVKGKRYVIRITAVSPSGEKTVLEIPFVA